MKRNFILPLLALGLAAASATPLAAQSGGSFSLPSNPSPTPTPTVQGPVDDSGVVPVGPRTIPTASPTPTATLAPTPQPSPTPTRPPATGPVGQSATRPAPQTGAPRPQRQLPVPVPLSPLDIPAAAPTGPSITDPLPAPNQTDVAEPARGTTSTAPNTQASEPATTQETSGPAFTLPDWWWIAALALAAIMALAACIVFWRRRQAAAPPPEIERPVVSAADDSAPVIAADLLQDLQIEIEPVRISRSFMASTLSYRLTLINRAASGMRHISLDGDLTSAHGGAPIDEQLADALTALPQIHTLDYLGPGQRKSFTGDVRLELKDVRPIRQGNVPIFVPLMRIKAAAAAAEVRAYTFVIGKRPGQAGGRLQPFRLDTPPQTHHELASRLLG